MAVEGSGKGVPQKLTGENVQGRVTAPKAHSRHVGPSAEEPTLQRV